MKGLLSIMSAFKQRYLASYIEEDLQKKMVFLGGPRQVGKTALGLHLSEQFKDPLYLNWDSTPHRERILKSKWPVEIDFILLDEIHKYGSWKRWIKGIWDTRLNYEKIMVTGSSKLDVYRRGGDSLLGRYHYYHLHPFSLAEINRKSPASLESRPTLGFDQEAGKGLDLLFQFGGFPEPFLSGRQRTLRRWHRSRFERIFREDIRDLENIRSLSQLELLGRLLPSRVGAPLSYRSLLEDVETSPKTIKQWIDLLCQNYYLFKVPPYHQRLERALKKEAKYYLWDWSEVKDDGIRFENMVAAHLLKFCHFYQDTAGYSVELYYLRDLEKREVDFLVVWESQPWFMVECKLKAKEKQGSLVYFSQKLEVADRFVVTLADEEHYIQKSTGVHFIPASRFLMVLQ